MRGQLGELFYQTGDCVLALDAERRVRRLNPAGERLLGYDEEHLLGQPIATLFPNPDELKQALRLLAETDGTNAESCIATVRTRAGRLLRARCRIFSLDGEEAGHAMLIKEEPPADIDARGAALIRQLNQLAETWISLVGESDLDLVGQSLADLAKELLAADFTGLALVRPDHNGGFETVRFNFNASRPFFPERLPRPVGVLGLALESRALVRIDDIRTHRGQMGLPSKQTKIGPFLAVPLLGKGAVMGELLAANRPGGPAFTVLDEAIAVQLGTIATAAVETARLKAEADELTRRRKEMVAAVAHDLRTPITTVVGYSELAGEAGLSDEARERVMVRLREQRSQVGRLLDDLTTASSLETGRLSVEPADVALDALLGELCDSVRVRHPDRDLKLRGKRHLDVRADRVRLRQMLTNLVDNAVKYSAPETPVTIATSAGEGEVQIAVSDQGAGIQPEELDQVFELFYRTRTATRRASGMGLGLAIVRGLAEAMGGSVGADSKVGEGTTITVSLPAA